MPRPFEYDVTKRGHVVASVPDWVRTKVGDLCVLSDDGNRVALVVGWLPWSLKEPGGEVVALTCHGLERVPIGNITGCEG